MKKFRRFISLMLVLMLCVTMAISASAVKRYKDVPAYGTMCGEFRQTNSTSLSVRTTVSANDDNAILKNDVEILDQSSDSFTYHEYSSNRGARSYSHIVPLYQTVDQRPAYAYCAHNIYRGTLHKPQVIRTEIPINH